MNTTSSSESTAHGTALVLGGGGSAGNAWLIGVIAGLLDGGLDVTDADLIIGTSAGATAAAQITGASASSLLADILSSSGPTHPAPARPTASALAPVDEQLRRGDDIIAAAAGLADMLRRMGAAALEADAETDGSMTAQWRSTVAARLPQTDWPLQEIRLTAVDARCGEPVVFDRHSGVALVDAVAASTSGGRLPYRIGDERYIDGGYRRSSENADLAAGYERVLVLSPLGGRTRYPLSWGMHLAVQTEELRAGGGRVEVMLPDEDSLEAFGGNMMNPATRVPAARAGHRQGLAAAHGLVAFWR
ncbi:patatin-like phospholipase family protein [Microbacteriaceae bacterium VKM Ac-2855]|nr:patatin-like phospholipase family protein [Microbacteriaceae bacterium VKM Ac-2855]